MVPCPAQSRRHADLADDTPISFYTTATVPDTGVYTIKSVNGDFDAFIIVSGSEKWVKISQWTDKYTPTTKAFGTVATAETKTGKLADAQINFLSASNGQRLYRVDWDDSQKAGDKRLLYIKTNRAHQDGRPSFGLVGEGTTATLASSTPTDANKWFTYTETFFDGLITSPESMSKDDCQRLIMGSNGFDCVGNPGFRCFVAGRQCGDSASPMLKNVKLFVRLDVDVQMFPTTDEAYRKMITLTNSSVVEDYESPIPSCDCFVGMAGGYDWVKTQYMGGCSTVACPANTDCSALSADPATKRTSFGCAKGYQGRVIWDGASWINQCNKVDCPAESMGHPDCLCQYGYRGSVDYTSAWNETGYSQSSTYTEKCDFVACPQGTMIRGSSNGMPSCVCPTGFSGKSSWDISKQTFGGAQACIEESCPDSIMIRSADRTKCTCPVGYNGKASWVDGAQTYAGTQTCVKVPCPQGATCDSSADERRCNTYFSGFFSWDFENQVWTHNCSLVQCPTNSKQRSASSPSGCVCTSGFAPAAAWVDATQSYTGCNKDADCPKGADVTVRDATSGAKLCSCLPGYTGLEIWDETSAAFTHTCTLVECSSGSVRQTTNLCDCDVGFTGGLTWSTSNQRYLGSCAAASCPTPGVNCTYSIDSVHRAQYAQLPCNMGYTGTSTWDYKNRNWMNNCVLKACPANTVRMNDHECNCRWGFGGSVSWDWNSADYKSGCTAVACAAPSLDSGDGHCNCPYGTSHGFIKFTTDDRWQVSCEKIAPCLENSAGGADCTCNKGFKGSVQLEVSISNNDNQEITATEQTSTRSGGCVAQACPVFSLEGSFPDCSCDIGYAGKVDWTAAQTWSSNCAVVQCPEFTTGAPSCKCNKGYLGKLSFNLATQKWEGTCTLAACPANATSVVSNGIGSCKCKNGFSGTQTWNSETGWTHTCVDVPCPALSNKVRGDVPVSYQIINKFIGCHDASGKVLGMIGTPQQILGTANVCEGTSQMSECIAYAKSACDSLVESGQECWGFAVSQKLDVQMYNSKASDYSVCDADNGLKSHPEWTSYRRRSSFGDCQCVAGFGGGFVFTGTSYAGACNKDVCPVHSDCGEKIVCHQGYRGATNFTWDWDSESWVGTCSPIGCGVNDRAESFPNCECGTGYAGGAHGWNSQQEAWTGDCKKVDCVANTDNNFPTCKCSSGFVRSDDVANRAITWSGSEWQQTCKAVACPAFAQRVSGGSCACKVGYQGIIKFSLETALFTVSGGSTDMSSCLRVQCPANSTETIYADPEGKPVPSCKCQNGFAGNLVWDPETFSWGTCTYVGCPAHSSGHPNCLCDAGYQGSVQWGKNYFTGACTAIDTTPVWKNIDDLGKTITCRRIQGASTTLASVDTADSEIDFVFSGSSDTINIVRCDMKLGNEFTKISGSVTVTPTSNSKVLDSQTIVTWNSTVVGATTGYISIGTPYNIVQAGGSLTASATQKFIQNIPETSVTQTDTIRFEIHEPAGVTLTLSQLAIKVYSIPNDVVNCVRTSPTQ